MTTMMGQIGSGMRSLMGSMMGTGQGQPPGPQRPPKVPGMEELRFAEDYVTFVNKEYERRRTSRLGWELQTRLNLEFIQGNQFLDVNNITQSLQEEPLLHDYEEREVFNQLAPIFEVRVARLSRGRVVRKVRPASNQQRDIAAAQISGDLIAWGEQETDHRQRMSELIPWLEASGTAYELQAWHPHKGKLVGYSAGENGQQEPVHEGNIDPEVISPFEVYPDTLFQTYRRNRSIVWARAYHIATIWDEWGVEVQAEQCDSYTLQSTTTAVRTYGSVQTGFRLDVTRLENHAVVKHYFERPSKRHVNGRHIVVANKRLLHAGELPYRCGKDRAPDIPLVPLYLQRIPGRFFGDTIYPRLIPVQRRYNSLRNRKAEYLKRAAIGQPVIEEGSLANQEEIEANFVDPGQEWMYKRGFTPPRYMEFPNLPAAFDSEIQDCLHEFTSLSGVSDLAKMSTAPAGVKSGVALSIAMEQDETRMATPANHIEEGLIEEAQIWLRLWQQFGNGPRIARVVNRSEVELIDWTGADLTSDDVIIEGGSGLAESPAQRRQMVFDVLSTTLLNDPDTGRIDRAGRAKILEMIDMGHWESAADSDYDLQVSRAKRQIARVKSGILPLVEPQDDPLIHLSEMRRWMLSSEYEEKARDQRIQFAAYQWQAELMQGIQRQAMAAAAMRAPAQEQGQVQQGSVQPAQQAAM